VSVSVFHLVLVEGQWGLGLAEQSLYFLLYEFELTNVLVIDDTFPFQYQLLNLSAPPSL
jgi:hypothetical protein